MTNLPKNARIKVELIDEDGTLLRAFELLADEQMAKTVFDIFEERARESC